MVAVGARVPQAVRQTRAPIPQALEGLEVQTRLQVQRVQVAEVVEVLMPRAVLVVAEQDELREHLE